ncbi:hypothetical protein DKX38_026889 [Salix brachista]|uniref:Calponin-homology (CH) domain-containing protein n=1 Tax=Salix brachista TaxID=2182728 RepID=A0A5N5JAT7_9ROSI|nr:hypothetical protein DKX38_026889 [Salix brachista]
MPVWLAKSRAITHSLNRKVGFIGILHQKFWTSSSSLHHPSSLSSIFIPAGIHEDHSNPHKGKVIVGDFQPVRGKLKAFIVNKEEIAGILNELYGDLSNEIEFEDFLKATTMTLFTISESEKVSYVDQIYSYLGDDPFRKHFLPIDPATKDLFNLVKDGVLLCKLTDIVVPGIIDERAVNIRTHGIGCTVVNIRTQDLVEGRPASNMEKFGNLNWTKLFLLTFQRLNRSWKR